MAVAEQAIVARLEAVSGVTDLASTRIYPVKLPQSATLEAITYQRVSTRRGHLMGTDDGIAYTRVQVTSWAETYSEAKALAEAVRVALQRFSGTVGGLEVLDVMAEAELDLYGDDESDSGVHAVAQDFTVIHRE